MLQFESAVGFKGNNAPITKIYTIMIKKNNAVKAQVENVNAVENTTAEATPQVAPQAEVENSELETKAEKAKAEAARLMEQAKKAAQEAKAAAKEAREAVKKAKALTSRPVRKNTFEVRVCQKMADVTLGGEYVDKSDVHYCAEKIAINCLTDLRAEGNNDEDKSKVYLINKVSKETDENGKPKESILISKLYLDLETNQIIID